MVTFIMNNITNGLLADSESFGQFNLKNALAVKFPNIGSLGIR